MNKDFENAIKLEESISLEEASNSRLVQNLTDNSSFAIISASRSEYSKGENFERTTQLKRDVKNAGYGFNEFVGRWVEQNPESGANDASDENSLLIKGIGKNLAMKLGAKYEQSSIIYKEGKDSIVEICTTPFTDYNGNKHKVGDIINNFHVDPKKPLNNTVASKIFSGKDEGPASRLVKGSNKKEFQLQEKYLVNTWQGFTYIPIKLYD